MQQIADELKYACDQFDRSEWLRILMSCTGRASTETAKSKYYQVRSICRLARSVAQRYKRNGIRKSARYDAQRVADYVVSIPDRTRRCVETFRNLSKEKQTDQVVNLLLTWIIFWASAGGNDMEGGLPDLDLALCISDHRNIVSHTVLLGLGTEIALRLAVELLSEVYHRLPEPHSRAWDTSYQFIQKHKNASICAIWAGIGLHFLKDASLFADATKPYTGLPVPLPMEAHQALFAANGIACEATAFAGNKRDSSD